MEENKQSENILETENNGSNTNDVLDKKRLTFKSKKIIISGIALFVILSIFGVRYVLEENYKNEVLKSIELVFIDEPRIEYGDQKFDYNTLIKNSTGDPEITLPDNIDTKKIGDIDLKYIVSKEGYSKEQIISVSVTDTKAPVITLSDDAHTINVDGEFDVEKNITSVKDPVDGDIAFLSANEIETKKAELQEGETLKGYYSIDGTVDTTTAGEYSIAIFAIDINGNEAKKEFVVSVLEEDEIAVNGSNGSSNGTSNYYRPGGGNAGGSSDGGNSSNGGGSSSGGSSSGGSSGNGSAQICDLPVGNSGKWYNSEQEANNIGVQLMNDPTSPYFTRQFYTWGNSICGYTIEWN